MAANAGDEPGHHPDDSASDQCARDFSESGAQHAAQGEGENENNGRVLPDVGIACRLRLVGRRQGFAVDDADDLSDPGSRNLVLQIGEAYFHGFVVRHGGQVRGYVDRCPHTGVPLTGKVDGYLTPDNTLIVCSWHGALFRPEDGLCVGGPCAGARLSPWSVTVKGDYLKTA